METNLNSKPDWWEDPRLAVRIGSALQHFVEARENPEDQPLRRCRDLLSGINVLYSALQYQCIALRGESKGNDRHDAAMLTQLLLRVPTDRSFLVDGPLLGLAMLEPPIMDQSVLIKQLDDPWLEAEGIPDNIRQKASSKHSAFKAQFQNYAQRGTGYRRLLRELASTISVFRNNLQHGEKAGGRRRDILVAEVMCPALEEAVDLILNYPTRKLATYGLLTDDTRFTELTGTTPKRYDACGTVVSREGLRYFRRSNRVAECVAVSVAEFPGTLSMYRRLDAFEGTRRYRRVLISARSGTRTAVCNIYEGILP